MTETFGISGGGRSAEEEFIRLTGAHRPARAAQGDCVLEGTPIEIKRATSTTLNQVRAVKFIPLVVYYVPADTWYVVPASRVVALVSRKARGQHTENPFESATLSIRQLDAYRISDRSLLKEYAIRAIQDGAQHAALRDAMDDVLQQSRDLAMQSLAKVRALVAGMPIDG